MVKVALAGGSGGLAREVLDALIAIKKHDIIVLSRSPPPKPPIPTITWHTTTYTNIPSLAAILQGVETVLSFINQSVVPEGENPQRNLIDACVEAGVKRFAPSEYGCGDKSDLPFWQGKVGIASYLEEINKDGKVLEYTLFTPGLFLNYLATPHFPPNSTYITPLDTFISPRSRHAILVTAHEHSILTLTSSHDLANIIALAVSLPLTTPWPVKGGVCGNRYSVKQILETCERVRGGEWVVEWVDMGELERGEVGTGWGLGVRHPAFEGGDREEGKGKGREGEGGGEEGMDEMLKMVLVGMLKSSAKGAWDVGDEWNRVFPEYEFEGLEQFLRGVWEERE